MSFSFKKHRTSQQVESAVPADHSAVKTSKPTRGPAAQILKLQKQAGNRAVERLLHPQSNNQEIVPGGDGRPLPSRLRSSFEERFGQDFGKVRVHASDRAAQSAGALNAVAYTVGNDVVFGAGSFDSQSKQGKHLLAHELAHVVQQSRGGDAPASFNTGSGLEQAANRAAAEFSSSLSSPEAQSHSCACEGGSAQCSTPSLAAISVGGGSAVGVARQEVPPTAGKREAGWAWPNVYKIPGGVAPPVCPLPPVGWQYDYEIVLHPDRCPEYVPRGERHPLLWSPPAPWQPAPPGLLKPPEKYQWQFGLDPHKFDPSRPWESGAPFILRRTPMPGYWLDADKLTVPLTDTGKDNPIQDPTAQIGFGPAVNIPLFNAQTGDPYVGIFGQIGFPRWYIGRDWRYDEPALKETPAWYRRFNWLGEPTLQLGAFLASPHVQIQPQLNLFKYHISDALGADWDTDFGIATGTTFDFDATKHQWGVTPFISPFWQQAIKLVGGDTVLQVAPQFSYDPNRGYIGVISILFGGQQGIGRPDR